MPFTVAVTGQILIHDRLDLSAGGQRQVMDFLAADAAFANLEATVAIANAWPTKVKTLHLASPEALLSVRALGFHAVTHANNHAFDLGPPGIVATRAAAETAGLKLAGSGATIDAAAAPAIISTGKGPSLAIFSVDLGPQPEINYASADRAGIAPLKMSRSVDLPPAEFDSLQRIARTLGDDRRGAARAAVGYDAGKPPELELFGVPITRGDQITARWTADEQNLSRLTRGIANARSAGHAVAVAVHGHHWDADWSRTSDWLLDLARTLIDAGADLILGTGAPVMQPIAFYRDRAIIIGLGNFVFHTNRPATYDEKGVDVWRSAAIRLTLSEDGACERLDLLPIAVGRPADKAMPAGPVPLRGGDAEEIRRRAFSRLSPADLARCAAGDG